ncbi:MAG TPA: YbhB/YbcL family Raf kinase inhibitor-like protein [Thermodesulfobacteriota bacterium]|nr:YbhB/YbcL family Raf kinase inhibitor-like protein [Thermodesulfobacteriota bacterium]
MVQKSCILVTVLFLLLLFLSHSYAQSKSETTGGKNMGIKVTSTAFEDGGMIPKKYTCDGQDISPPLSWDSVPDRTKSIALISSDPDAPRGTWTHWVIYNIPPDARGLPENVPTQKTLQNGAKQGINDFRKIGYGGPCPPGGTHRYYFNVYALDTEIDLDAGASEEELFKAMEGHILAEGELMGKYKR